MAIGSAVAGFASLALLYQRRYLAVRITAGAAVATVLWAWAVAQYPYLLPPDTVITDVAAQPVVLRTALGAVAVGALILVPSLWWMLRLFQSGDANRPART
jgi:cytochrome d ubiquinol oxidase subunit II